MGTDAYDFIIVGGGSAGSALASRLSADPATKVLVLKPSQPAYRSDVLIHMPTALTFPITTASTTYHWGRTGAELANRRITTAASPRRVEQHQRDDLPAATRGLRAPAAPGIELFAYFKRMENCLAGDEEYRGHAGPFVLERGPADNVLFQAFFAAAEQAG